MTRKSMDFCSSSHSAGDGQYVHGDSMRSDVYVGYRGSWLGDDVEEYVQSYRVHGL